MSNCTTPLRKAWCYTNVRKAQYKFTWTIDSFSSFWTWGDVPTIVPVLLLSSTFSTKTSDDKLSEWTLRLSSKYLSATAEWVSVYLQLTSTEKAQIRAKYRIYLLDDTGIKKCISSTGDEIICFNLLNNSTRSYPDFVMKNVLLDKDNRLLIGDKLTVVCEMTIIEDEPVNISGQIESLTLQAPSAQLSNDYSKLLETKKMSDVTIVAGGKEFPAHTVILSARSAVFAAMFEHGMEETKNNRVKITDIDHDVMWEVLRYIYTGTTNKLEQMAGELFAAAEKYDLEELKLKCEDSLRMGLSVSNAAHILVLAELHNAKVLKAQATDFINANLLEVMATTEFKAVNMANPDIIAEVLAEVAALNMRGESE